MRCGVRVRGSCHYRLRPGPTGCLGGPLLPAFGRRSASSKYAKHPCAGIVVKSITLHRQNLEKLLPSARTDFDPNRNWGSGGRSSTNSNKSNIGFRHEVGICFKRVIWQSKLKAPSNGLMTKRDLVLLNNLAARMCSFT